MKNKFYVLFLFFAFSCQTLDVRERATLSSSQKVFFDTASKEDGYAYFEIIEGKEKKYSGDLEWIVKENDSFSFELLDPLGNSLGKGKKTKNSLLITGREFKKFEMPIDSHDFLHFHGHWIGLKSSEFARFLKGKLPSEWLDDDVFKVGEGQNHYYLPKGSRDITLDFFPNKSKKSFKGMCAKITWKSFWIFKTSEIFLCFTTQDKKTSWINFDHRLKLKIKDIYEEE